MSTVEVMTVETDPQLKTALCDALAGCGRYEVREADPTRWHADIRSHQPAVLLLGHGVDEALAASQVSDVVRHCPTTMVAALTDGSQTPGPAVSGAFAAYTTADISQLPDQLERDLMLFRRALEGRTVAPPSLLANGVGHR